MNQYLNEQSRLYLQRISQPQSEQQEAQITASPHRGLGLSLPKAVKLFHIRSFAHWSRRSARSRA